MGTRHSETLELGEGNAWVLSSAVVQRGWAAAEELGTELGDVILVLYMAGTEYPQDLTWDPNWQSLHAVRL